MKADFNESPFCTWVDLIPETPEDVAALLRMVENTKAQKPELIIWFKKGVSAQIYMKKIDEKAQTNAYSNK